VIRPPPPEFVAAAPAFYRGLVAILNPLIVAVDGSVTSWYRDPFDNARVGGNRCSQHLIGAGVDVVVPDDRVDVFVEAVRRAGLTALDEGDHVHIQALPAGTLDRFGLCSTFV